MQVKIIVGEWELREKGSRKKAKVEGIKGITNNEKKLEYKKQKQDGLRKEKHNKRKGV